MSTQGGVPKRPCSVCRAGILTETQVGDWIDVACDTCGYSASCHKRRVDPEIRRQRLRALAAIPPKFAGRPFDRDDTNREAVAAVEAWVADYGTWRRARADDPGYDERPPAAPAIYGRQGRGKSHLLCRLGERLVDDIGCSVMFRTARLLLRSLQDFHGNAEHVWRDAVGVDVLLLDDLGAQRSTDWRNDQLAELIDERYQRLLPVAVTTNMPPALWEELVDLRTASRLHAMTTPVELDGGEDRRVLAHSTTTTTTERA